MDPPPERAVFKILMFLVIFVRPHYFILAVGNTTVIDIIKDGGHLVSSNKNFVLGFFSFHNSTTRRYVGIWYNKIPELTPVWIANRDQPLNDTSGTLALDGHGNVVVYSPAQRISIWSTNASIPASNDVSVELWDTGNLAVVQRESRRVIWQSFDYPTHTMLPYMKLGLNRRTGFSWSLTSWKAEDDPGTGNFSCRMDTTGYPQLVLYEGDVPWWRVG
ncbi:G-type lectin S-receptor-like serine/threonine-protein kinase RKS1, partial [Momordica charantia]|uniref:G-type lectin S-receptor-like serine/threonine-protein kinase RKS1 n=1 Tax=Momordica charantia TaxID=3673 RepID=A0A6J1CE95_MOMCH